MIHLLNFKITLLFQDNVPASTTLPSWERCCRVRCNQPQNNRLVSETMTLALKALQLRQPWWRHSKHNNTISRTTATISRQWPCLWDHNPTSRTRTQPSWQCLHLQDCDLDLDFETTALSGKQCFHPQNDIPTSGTTTLTVMDVI
jgi:hypothetical protein